MILGDTTTTVSSATAGDAASAATMRAAYRALHIRLGVKVFMVTPSGRARSNASRRPTCGRRSVRDVVVSRATLRRAADRDVGWQRRNARLRVGAGDVAHDAHALIPLFLDEIQPGILGDRRVSRQRHVAETARLVLYSQERVVHHLNVAGDADVAELGVAEGSDKHGSVDGIAVALVERRPLPHEQGVAGGRQLVPAVHAR